MPKKNIATVVPKELNFPKQVGASVTRTVRIKNNASNASLAFKLQCNAPARYAVTPASGIVQPTSEQSISVRLKALESIDFENSDKFLVRVTPLDPQESEFPTENWSSLPKTSVMKYLIKVDFHLSPHENNRERHQVKDTLKMSRNQPPTNHNKQLWTPQTTNNTNNHATNNTHIKNLQMSRFSTPMAPAAVQSTPGQVKQAAQARAAWPRRRRP